MPAGWKQPIAAMGLFVVLGCVVGCNEPQADLEGAAQPPSPPVGTVLDGFSFAGPGEAAAAWSAASGLRIGREPVTTPSVSFVHVFQPDCLACTNHARELERFRLGFDRAAVGVVGVAHKQDADAVTGFARETGAAYPLVVATGSDWASRWSRGDPMYVVDRTGRIVYAQVGFHPSDAALWAEVVEDVLAGRPPRDTGPARNVLQDGDRFPSVILPDLDSGDPMTLATDDDGRLFFEREGRVRQWRAAVGFFTRY